jgi:hypothetical protein
MYIYDRGDVVSAIGATVVGVLGSMYGHFSKGDALPSMMPGILVLLPVMVSCYTFLVCCKLIIAEHHSGWFVCGRWAKCQFPQSNKHSYQLAHNRTWDGSSHNWHHCWSFCIHCSHFLLHVDSELGKGSTESPKRSCWHSILNIDLTTGLIVDSLSESINYCSLHHKLCRP